MLKFDFSLKTRDGHQIVNVQMYHHCEVLNCTTTDADKNTTRSMDIEELLTLIAKQQ
jgi:hypothetical protein